MLCAPSPIAGRISGAPFLADVADAPPEARAVWWDAPDGVRLRLAMLARGERGTVLLLPGRTEYVEKYGRVAGEFQRHGYGVVTIDWRGQGLADRFTRDPRLGHVGAFADYQQDLQGLVEFARKESMPEPWHMLAHSMGGAIGLRGLERDLPVRSAAFSAPMWGINMAPALKPVAWSVGWLVDHLDKSEIVTPGMSRESVLKTATIEDNLLTHDPEMLRYMQQHLAAEPALCLGGPTISWLYKALVECRDLSRIADPGVPTLTVLPDEEEIVDPVVIRALTSRWPGAELLEIRGGRHETMMETADRRRLFFKTVTGFLNRH